jgi:hypothetical protein
MFSFFFSFVSSWLHLRVLEGKQKLRLLKNDFVTGHFLHEKVIRIWSWEWSILSWQCSVWKCVQSLQSLIYAHMVPCIEFPCSVFRHSLHIHTGHTWFEIPIIAEYIIPIFQVHFPRFADENAKIHLSVLTCLSVCQHVTTHNQVFTTLCTFSQILRFSRRII